MAIQGIVPSDIQRISSNNGYGSLASYFPFVMLQVRESGRHSNSMLCVRSNTTKTNSQVAASFRQRHFLPVLTVSPNKQYLGFLVPTTSATTDPE